MPDLDPRHDSRDDEGGAGHDTREALLDAAQRLFAERGIGGASLRAITGAAGANLAAVSYHFGSKEGLVKALFARGLRHLNDERLRLLEACEAASEPPSVECLVRAFADPMVRHLHHDGGGDFPRLVARVLWESDAETRHLLFDEFRPVIERFAAAFARACPQVPPVEVLWRFHFLVGSLAYAVGQRQTAAHFSAGACAATDAAQLTEYLSTFLTTAWQAPPTPVGDEAEETP
jgi:AcrR family transcriptional regulator